MFLFVSCNIINSEFDSQTKTRLILVIKNFELLISFIKKILSSTIITFLLEDIKRPNDKAFKKLEGKKKYKLNMEKLDDANLAGSKYSEDCVLILTEGDSAKTLAVAGISISPRGRDKYGIYPLKGKLLNVRGAKKDQILKNDKINDLIKILGLEFNKKYESISKLRYGKILLMTDQDQDGSHTKGLVINFIQYFWPELLKLNFIEEFITPIIKVRVRNGEKISFFNLRDYENWSKENNAQDVKYYKGLGTSVREEGREYFSAIDKHKYSFFYRDKDDEEIIKAFDKKKVSERKARLIDFMNKNKDNTLQEDSILYNRNNLQENISYSDFINKELVFFSHSDNIRSIPNMMDGLKPSQRKIILVCIKTVDKHEMKVEQLSGLISTKTAYKHGEQSLKMAIINLANDFLGSNNINLLHPSGNFGTRLSGGKDAASRRYIYTKLTEITKFIFKDEDFEILKHQIEENKHIEPEFFTHIIPMILVNGALGIGTGWSCKIPSFNPLDIIKELISLLLKEKEKSNFNFKLWYRIS